MAIDGYRFIYHASDLYKVIATLQQIFTLDNAIDSFSQRLLVTVIAVCHGARQSLLAMNSLAIALSGAKRCQLISGRVT